MGTTYDESKRLSELNAKIKQHDARLAQLRAIPNYQNSPNLLAEIEQETHEREQHVSERVRIKQLLQLKEELTSIDQKIAQQERMITRQQQQVEAAQRVLEQAEKDLASLLVDRQKKQSQLDNIANPVSSTQTTRFAGDPVSMIMVTSPAPAFSPPAAVLLLPDGTRLPFPPQKEEIIIGREGSDINLSSIDAQALVSRRHARINYQQQQWTITDLKSTNHTWVGTKQLTPYVPMTISHGTPLTFGTITVTFLVG